MTNEIRFGNKHHYTRNEYGPNYFGSKPLAWTTTSFDRIFPYHRYTFISAEELVRLRVNSVSKEHHKIECSGDDEREFPWKDSATETAIIVNPKTEKLKVVHNFFDNYPLSWNDFVDPYEYTGFSTRGPGYGFHIVPPFAGPYIRKKVIEKVAESMGVSPFEPEPEEKVRKLPISSLKSLESLVLYERYSEIAGEEFKIEDFHGEAAMIAILGDDKDLFREYSKAVKDKYGLPLRFDLKLPKIDTGLANTDCCPYGLAASFKENIIRTTDQLTEAIIRRVKEDS